MKDIRNINVMISDNLQRIVKLYNFDEISSLTFITISLGIIMTREPSRLSNVFKFYDIARLIKHLYIKQLYIYSVFIGFVSKR